MTVTGKNFSNITSAKLKHAPVVIPRMSVMFLLMLGKGWRLMSGIHLSVYKLEASRFSFSWNADLYESCTCSKLPKFNSQPVSQIELAGTMKWMAFHKSLGEKKWRFNSSFQTEIMLIFGHKNIERVNNYNSISTNL